MVFLRTTSVSDLGRFLAVAPVCVLLACSGRVDAGDGGAAPEAASVCPPPAQVGGSTPCAPNGLACPSMPVTHDCSGQPLAAQCSCSNGSWACVAPAFSCPGAPPIAPFPGDDASVGDATAPDVGAACVPASVNAGTVDAGATYACLQRVCAMQRSACASDCDCNNNVGAALQCVAGGGSNVSCFGPLATSSNTLVTGFLQCLVQNQSACGTMQDGGAE